MNVTIAVQGGLTEYNDRLVQYLQAKESSDSRILELTRQLAEVNISVMCEHEKFMRMLTLVFKNVLGVLLEIYFIPIEGRSDWRARKADNKHEEGKF